MCGNVAQWLRFWTVNHDTMGSNLAEKVYIFLFLLTCFLTPQTFNTAFVPNVLLKSH